MKRLSARLFGGQNQKCGSHKIKTQDTNNSWVSLWARQDSNLRPNGYEPSALTTELRALRAGDRIRTGECQLGRLMPYHLATPAGFCEINFTIMGGEVNHPLWKELRFVSVFTMVTGKHPQN